MGTSSTKRQEIVSRLKVVGLLLLVWWLGWQTHSFRSPPTKKASSTANKGTVSKKPVTWTCSMHPQIKLPKKGKCPICFMDLIPLKADSGGGAPTQVKLSALAKALAEIQTTKVERRPVFLRVRMTGRVLYDETRVKTITSWISGRLERLYVDYTGVQVKRGHHLVKIYSPGLISAQQELLQALKEKRRTRRFARHSMARKVARNSWLAARHKLRLLGLKKWQLQRLEKNRKLQLRTTIYAPIGGVVVSKKAREGMYVKTGTPIYTIADLSKVWVRFDAYERDLPWLHVGQTVKFSTVSAPGETFSGKIAFIDPVLDPKTRTVGVRINVNNPRGLLKPAMFANGVVEVALNAVGKARTPDRGGRYSCPMHPEIVRKRRGNCPRCYMRLTRIKQVKQNPKHQHDPLLIPHSAPLLTGKRAVVYIRKPGAKSGAVFLGKEVVLGPRAGGFYVVLKGLKEGQEVVTNGAFKLDSELQIQAKPSMMSSSHKHHKHSKTPKTIKKITLSKRTLKKLTKLYAQYDILQMALSSDSASKSYTAYKELFRLVRRLRSLRGKGSLEWAKARTKLYNVLSTVQQQTSLKRQRALFQPVSRVFIRLMKSFGHSGKSDFRLAYCPMAFGYKGAYWLQSNKKLYNPYFGSQMLHCGEFKGTFRPVKKGRRKR